MLTPPSSPTCSDYTTGTGGLANQSKIEATGTNASIFLTVYPQTLLNQTNTTDLELLGQQILFYQSAPYNRTVFLRYAPEMQGNWNPYGYSPSSFVAGWKTMYTTIKGIASGTIIVCTPRAAGRFPAPTRGADRDPGLISQGVRTRRKATLTAIRFRLCRLLTRHCWTRTATGA